MDGLNEFDKFEKMKICIKRAYRAIVGNRKGLFICGPFKGIFSKSRVSEIIEWFYNCQKGRCRGLAMPNFKKECFPDKHELKTLIFHTLISLSNCVFFILESESRGTFIELGVIDTLAHIFRGSFPNLINNNFNEKLVQAYNPLDKTWLICTKNFIENSPKMFRYGVIEIFETHGKVKIFSNNKDIELIIQEILECNNC